MNKQLFFCTLFFCVQICTQAQSNIDVLHYEFEIQLSDKSDTIKGKAAILMNFLQATDSISLDLTSVKQDGKGMRVNRVMENNNLLNFFQSLDHLTLKFTKTKPGDSKIFIIEYAGIPSDGLIISKNKYRDRTFFADNWPNRAHNWIPCKDDPADKASFEFIVKAPSHYQVIANGFKSEEKIFENDQKLTHWVEDVPLSTKVMVIGVANFAIKEFEDSPKEIPVTAWVYPQDSVKGFQNYSVAPGILKFLSNYIGPYPYNKLANVQSKTIFGGMENASAIFYDESSATSPRSVESLLAHEITHQWFGDMASEKSFSHLWLSEGFATYFTHIYIESKYGTDSMNREMQNDRMDVIAFAINSPNPVVDSVTPFKHLLNANSYQKGSWVLHMLRRQLGDSVFHQIIRIYYEKYKGKNADTGDFEAVAEEVSHKNLTVFFNQWLYTPGLPQLHITWKYMEKDQLISVKVDQTQKNYSFTFPMELLITNPDGKSLIKKIYISKASETFTIPVTSKPDRVQLDPETSLLFEGAIEEMKN